MVVKNCKCFKIASCNIIITWLIDRYQNKTNLYIYFLSLLQMANPSHPFSGRKIYFTDIYQNLLYHRFNCGNSLFYNYTSTKHTKYHVILISFQRVMEFLHKVKSCKNLSILKLNIIIIYLLYV